MISIIEAVRDRKSITAEMIRTFIHGVVKNTIPDYQVAAWLMAVYLNGLAEPSVFELTYAMAEEGSDPITHRGVVDKHSTGGVGDKTTLILAPLVASLGIPVVKMSGRGLGHTGGTLDKLESIPGFRVQLDPEQMARQIDETGVAVIAQNARMAPSDGILYALRDVTGTVDSIPLIASSIMSKKIAAGAPNLVLDVKVGSGAMMKSLERAQELARLMVRIGKARGISVRALLTNMDQPLGRAIGNALEVNEALQCLRDEGPRDLTREIVTLASHMVSLAQREAVRDAEIAVTEALEDGRAHQKFFEWVGAQGGDVRALERGLPVASMYAATSVRDGTVIRINTAKVGSAAQFLGAGRQTKEDSIDFAVGIRWLAPIGTPLQRGETFAEIYARNAEIAQIAANLLRDALTLGDRVNEAPAILGIITDA